MIALIQRVSRAAVTVETRTVGEIGAGLLALIGVERGDSAAQRDRLLERVLTYRVFADAAGHMNLSLADTGGGLLLVPQFTLAADTRKGTRPGFSTAEAPDAARVMFDQFAAAARSRHPHVATGEFGAHMQVSLVNDGPVTFWLHVPPVAKNDNDLTAISPA
ncbi:MAG TPA: D-aminoacyl-tRNA deacylase [Steroidobacteraceae bacterium]|nr:D-aminoacyl-tRNA deacylase [Steroidobacteraceae bacterium]